MMKHAVHYFEVSLGPWIYIKLPYRALLEFSPVQAGLTLLFEEEPKRSCTLRQQQLKKPIKAIRCVIKAAYITAPNQVDFRQITFVCDRKKIFTFLLFGIFLLCGIVRIYSNQKQREACSPDQNMLKCERCLTFEPTAHDWRL